MQFEFASEVKAFPDLEFIGNDVFDLFEFCPGEHTFYAVSIQSSLASYLIYDPSEGTLETRRLLGHPASLRQAPHGA